MTREEAKSCIGTIEMLQRLAYNKKVIKQEVNAVLDDIRAEIEAYQSDAFYPDDVMINKRVLLDIIDKYKADMTIESEE